MSGVASQSKSLAADEVFELPPYADEIMISGAATPVLESSHDKTTFWLVGITAMDTEDSVVLYSVDEPVLKYIKADAAITVHYRISKR